MTASDGGSEGRQERSASWKHHPEDEPGRARPSQDQKQKEMQERSGRCAREAAKPNRPVSCDRRERRTLLRSTLGAGTIRTAQRKRETARSADFCRVAVMLSAVLWVAWSLLHDPPYHEGRRVVPTYADRDCSRGPLQDVAVHKGPRPKWTLYKVSFRCALWREAGPR
jgi:hypothetical protein